MLNEDDTMTCPQTVLLSHLPREKYPAPNGWTILHSQCSEFGVVEHLQLLDSGDSEIEAMVRYRSPASASSALRYFTGRFVPKSRQVEIRRGQLPDIYKKQTTLYMSNLPTELSDQELADLAGKHGRVRALKVLSRRSDCGARALVDMATPEDARAVMQQLGRNNNRINVRISDRKLLTDHSVTYVVTSPPPVAPPPAAPLPPLCMCCSPFSPLGVQSPPPLSTSAFVFPPSAAFNLQQMVSLDACVMNSY